MSLGLVVTGLLIGSAFVMLWYLSPWRSTTTRALMSEADPASAGVAAIAAAAGVRRGAAGCRDLAAAGLDTGPARLSVKHDLQ